jgi:hypothetical protein
MSFLNAVFLARISIKLFSGGEYLICQTFRLLGQMFPLIRGSPDGVRPSSGWEACCCVRHVDFVPRDLSRLISSRFW